MRSRRVSGTEVPSPAPGSPRRWLALVLLVAGAVIASVFFLRADRVPPGTERRAPGPIPPDEPAPLEALSTSPFHNTKPGIAYVGDQTCLGCHADYKAYRNHPMGRSLFRSADAPPLERFEAAAELAVRSGPFRFQVIRRDGKQIHREWCEDAGGKVVAEQQVEMDYSIGSGAQSRSYLFRRGDGIFESPITWYALKGKWDLSPGYAVNAEHFTRGATPQCLFCHAHEVRPLEDAVSGYRDPPFGQLAVGCERCHGPGALHAGSTRPATAPGEVDHTIVNPRHLAPALRDAICEQCHLQGVERVWRRGRSAFEYRPGLPLHEYEQVFVTPPELGTATKIVSHVEQMRQSACYAKSAGRFGCTSCHDPHGVPPAAEAVNFYQSRCRNCHAPAAVPVPGRVAAPDCSVPPAGRVARDGRTDCLACHMPRNPAETPHLAVTDHRLLRRPDQSRPLRSGFQPGDIPLVPFYRPHRLPNDPDDPEEPRDLALATVELAVQMGGANRTRELLVRRAGPLLDRAVARDRTDVPALEARALALLEVGEFESALRAAEAALARAPDRERALYWAFDAALALDRLDAAERYARRLTEKYPHYPANHERLAAVLVKRRAWSDALAAARAAVRGNPFRPEAREVLITALIEVGELAEARAEFEVVGVLDPAFQTKLREGLGARLGSPK